MNSEMQLDFYHEVTPVTEGTRYVLKTYLDSNESFLNNHYDDQIIEEEVHDCYTDSERELQDDINYSKLYNEDDDY